MSKLYPHVPPGAADAPDYAYLRQIQDMRSPHLLVSALTSHAHGWQTAIGLGSVEGAEHHAFLIYHFWEQMARLTGQVRQNQEAEQKAKLAAPDAPPR